MTLWSPSSKVPEIASSIDPVDITLTAYSSTNTLVQATHSITLSATGGGFIVPAGSNFNAKIAITGECNDFVNWTEDIVYDQSAAPIGDSRVYLDGNGASLLTESKDFLNSKVFAAQPLYDGSRLPVGGTLSAPILENDFIYKNNFIRNESNTPYASTDFDKNAPGTAGDLNSPNRVGEQPGTVGWYFSSQNTTEPFTPVTDYPYARSYTAPGPDPTTSKSSSVGNELRMGKGHEVTSQRQQIAVNELQHYYALQSYFVTGSTLTIGKGYKFISTDPNGKQSVIFQDANGRTIASALLNGSTYSDWSYTYYNDLGQVVAEVAPNGVVIGNTSLPQFVTTYKYDHLGRTIEVTSPDEGMSQFVYSTDGKIRFSQNAIQRAASPKKFSYTNYDYLGRPVESGEYTEIPGGYTFEPSTTTIPASNSVLDLVDINVARGHTIDGITSTTQPQIFKGISHKFDGASNIRCSDYTFIVYEKSFDPAQTNLRGQVSKTENEIASTLYSYDEFGQLTWSKQTITGLGSKQIDYKYDYYGNVTEVGYQKADASEDFYHYYGYDKNSRLVNVQTSTDGSSKTQQAAYYYYLHGPLKRVELATNLQGIDYVYNIDGSLKMINHADPTMDPGGDGLSGSHANFRKDIFGEVIDYYTNDYSSRQASSESVNYNAATYPDKFGGIIKGVRWNGPTDLNTPTPKAYAYTYDSKYQLDNATFGNVTGSSPSYSFSPSTSYNEDIGGYDANGNISSLTRKDKSGNLIANFTYNYKTGNNQLDDITTTGTSTTVKDYGYNEIGQMTSAVENGITRNIIYNVFGLVKEIRDVNNYLVASYHYDDRGNRIKNVVYKRQGNADVADKTTYYVHDVSGNVLAIYEQLGTNAVNLAEVPVYGSGRLGIYKPGKMMLYEISDHLGNVRAVVGNVTQLSPDVATMEDNGQVSLTNPRVVELNLFKNIDETDVSQPYMNHTAPSVAVPSPDKSSLLRWISGQTGSGYTQETGPAIAYKVQPGDKIDIETWAKFQKTASYSRAGLTSTVASLLGGNFTNTLYGLESVPATTTVFQNGLTGLEATTGGTGPDMQRPYAFVYYLLLDKNFNPIPNARGAVRVPPACGFDAGSEITSTWGQLTVPTVTVKESGYVYIFVANESENTKVWFDDLKVTLTKGDIVAGADYYPFGLVINTREINREDYRFGYQGQYAEEDSVTGWNNFELRMYDSEIGRWLTIDPYGQFASAYMAVTNMPNANVDPDGGWSWVGAGMGSVIGGVAAYFATDGDWQSTIEGAVVGAVAGGLIGEWAHTSAGKDVQSANDWDRFTSIFGEGQMQPGGNTYSRWRPMGTKPAYTAIAPLEIPKPIRAEPALKDYMPRTLPSLINTTVTPKLPKVMTIPVKSQPIRWAGYSEDGSIASWNTNGRAADLASIYLAHQKMGASNIMITFTSTRPTLTTQNVARIITTRLIQLGVPRQHIIQGVIPVSGYGNRQWQQDNMHVTVFSTLTRFKK